MCFSKRVLIKIYRRLRRARTPALILIAAILATLVVAFVARDRDSVSVDPGPRHGHGLGSICVTTRVFVASHTGLYRIGRGERSASRVSDRYQDTMASRSSAPTAFSAPAIPICATSFRPSRSDPVA